MNTALPYYFKELADKNEVIITLEEGFIKVISIGEKTKTFTRNLWQHIVDSCIECDCFKILGIGLTTKAPAEGDVAEHVSIFKDLEIDHRFTIAWVEQNPEFKERIRTIETVLYNRGLVGKVFDDEETAESWIKTQ